MWSTWGMPQPGSNMAVVAAGAACSGWAPDGEQPASSGTRHWHDCTWCCWAHHVVPMLQPVAPAGVNSHSVDAVCVGAQQGAVLVADHVQAAHSPILSADGDREAIWRHSQSRHWRLMLSLQSTIFAPIEACMADLGSAGCIMLA